MIALRYIFILKIAYKKRISKIVLIKDIFILHCGFEFSG